MTFLQVAGHRIEYERLGSEQAGRPTLVLLHEGLGSVSHWRDVPARVAAATACEVWVYSRLGHGASDPAPLPRRVSFMHEEAQLLPVLLDATGISSAILVGHSDGASIALIYAAQAGPEDQRLRGLVLLAPHAFVEDLTVRSIARLREEYGASGLRERLRRHHGDRVDQTFYGWADVWLDPAFRNWDLTGLLPRIAVPVLVIQGQDDAYGTLAQVEAV